MAKKMYVGVNGVARKVKKIYVGVNGVARKVKKAYIGVAGIARLFFSGQRELVYNNTVPSLGKSRTLLEGASIGDYALFAGGSISGGYTDYVDAYDTSFTHSVPTNGLGYSPVNHRGVSSFDYAYFAGGRSYNDSTFNTVKAYDKYLTSVTGSHMTYVRRYFAAARAGVYVLFAGGRVNNYSSDGTNNVDAYSSPTSKVSVPNLSNSMCYMLGATVADTALFVRDGRPVEVYNSSLTHSIIDISSFSMNSTGVESGISTSEHALFISSTGKYAFDKSLTYSLVSGVSSRVAFASAGLSDYAVIACGCLGSYMNNSRGTNIVEAIDTSLVRTLLTNAFRDVYSGLAGASLGNDSIVFAGGSVQYIGDQSYAWAYSAE